MEPDEPLEIEIQHDQKVRFEVLIGILVLVILVLGGIIWYLLARHLLPPLGGAPQTATTTAQAPSAAQTVGDLSESSRYYDITAKYPATTQLSQLPEAQPNARAVSIMRQWEQGAIEQFKKDGNFANLTASDAQVMGLGDRKESLGISYKAANGNGTISYIFTITEDTFGAHPNTLYKTFTFDASTGTQMSVADLFAPGAKYLATLSTKARALLPPIIAKNEGVSQKDIDTKMLNDGTTPTIDSFADWYVDGTDLVLLFPPYQVAAYAAGPQTLRIPLAQLAGTKATTHVTDFGTVY